MKVGGKKKQKMRGKTFLFLKVSLVLVLDVVSGNPFHVGARRNGAKMRDQIMMPTDEKSKNKVFFTLLKFFVPNAGRIHSDQFQLGTGLTT